MNIIKQLAPEVVYSKCPLLEVPLYVCSLVCISSVCLCSKYLTHLMLMYVMGICTMKIRNSANGSMVRNGASVLQSLPQGIEFAVLDSARVSRNNDESC